MGDDNSSRLKAEESDSIFSSKMAHINIRRLIDGYKELAKHTQSLMNGIETGVVKIDSPADETLGRTLQGINKALASLSSSQSEGAK